MEIKNIAQIFKTANKPAKPANETKVKPEANFDIFQKQEVKEQDNLDETILNALNEAKDDTETIDTKGAQNCSAQTKNLDEDNATITTGFDKNNRPITVTLYPDGTQKVETRYDNLRATNTKTTFPDGSYIDEDKYDDGNVWTRTLSKNEDGSYVESEIDTKYNCNRIKTVQPDGSYSETFYNDGKSGTREKNVSEDGSYVETYKDSTGYTSKETYTTKENGGYEKVEENSDDGVYRKESKTVADDGSYELFAEGIIQGDKGTWYEKGNADGSYMYTWTKEDGTVETVYFDKYGNIVDNPEESNTSPEEPQKEE